MRNRDIVVRLREGGEDDLQYISTLHGAYDPLHFVLFFPHGDLGWMLNMHSQGYTPQAQTSLFEKLGLPDPTNYAPSCRKVSAGASNKPSSSIDTGALY